MKAFNYEINALVALQGLVKGLSGVPIRRQRQELIAAAERALPKNVAGQVFMAIGSGGELGQTGAAEALLDMLLPHATFRLVSFRGVAKTYDCAVFFSANGVQLEARSTGRPSMGVAMLSAAIEALIAATRVGHAPVPVRAKAGQPVTP